MSLSLRRPCRALNVSIFNVNVGRSIKLAPGHDEVRLLFHRRRYATRESAATKDGISSSRKQVTVISDDGRTKWSDLSTREKAARTTQQSFNLLIILAGVVMTVRTCTVPPLIRLSIVYRCGTRKTFSSFSSSFLLMMMMFLGWRHHRALFRRLLIRQ